MAKQKDPNVWGYNDLMVVAAFRYCLGRMTYIVGTCCDWIIRYWEDFRPETRQLIKYELDEAFRLDDEARANGTHKHLGWDCDRKEWERVRALWHVNEVPHD